VSLAELIGDSPGIVASREQTNRVLSRGVRQRRSQTTCAGKGDSSSGDGP
jgi:hypothetical protein